MPKIATKPTAKEKPKPAPTKEPAREVVYPDFVVSAKVGEKAVTEEYMRGLLFWESEKEFAARLMADNPNLLQDACKIPEKDVLLKDEDGSKVACWANVNNRPFQQARCDQYVEDMLAGRWRRNGEAFIIGKTGRCISIQHRGPAFVRACQRWRKDPQAYPLFGKDQGPSTGILMLNGQPVLQCVIVFGVEEDEETVNTIDDTMPRNMADVVMTSDMFGGMAQDDRQRAARSMKGAVEFLWKRLRPGECQSNSAAVQFSRRHPTLEPIVKHLVEENKGKALSLLRITGGASCSCPGMCYLMATGGADAERYHNTLPKVEPDLKQLGRAKLFFTLLAKGDTEVKAVCKALGALFLPNQADGMGGRASEKLAILAKAWAIFGGKQRRPITDDDLKLTYVTKDGAPELIDGNNFGGIDLGEKPSESEINDPPAPLTPEELERRKAEVNAGKNHAPAAAKADKNAPPLSDAELLARRNAILENRKKQTAK